MNIDYKKIDEFIEKVPKPPYCMVDEEEWRNALRGIREGFSNCDDDGFTTDTLWSLLFFSAASFCKGMMWSEVKNRIRDESNYPRY